jgi:hypothetical protein
MCCVQHLGRYLEGQGHSMTLQQNRVQSITSLFEVGCNNYFTEMITILRQCVAHHIWVVFNTLNFVCDITLTLQDLFGEHHPVQPALVLDCYQTLLSMITCISHQ